MRLRTISCLLSALPLVASIACSDDDTNEPAPSTDAGQPLPDVGFIDSGIAGGAPVDLNGTWAALRISSQCFDGALGNDRVVFTWMMKHEITSDGSTAQMTTEVCDLQLTDYRGSETTYPAAAIAGFDARDVNAVVGASEVGGSFVTLAQPIILGWEPNADPIDEVLPQDDNDPRLRDVDNDGNPGATLNVTGLVSGDVYIANRNVTIATGAIIGEDRIAGTIGTTAAQRIVDASAILLNNNGTAVTDDPNPDASPFEMVRVMSNTTCADIVSMAQSLFTDTSTDTPSDCP